MKVHNFFSAEIPDEEMTFGINSNLPIEETPDDMRDFYIQVLYKAGGPIELLWLRDVNPHLKEAITEFLNDPIGTYSEKYGCDIESARVDLGILENGEWIGRLKESAEIVLGIK